MFLRTNRIYHNEPILNTTSCKAFCSEKDGSLIDADLFHELDIHIPDEDKNEEYRIPSQKLVNFVNLALRLTGTC